MGLSLCLSNFKVRPSSSGVQILGLPPLTCTHFHALFLDKYVPITLRNRKKNELMTLEQGGMSVATYEAKFHALYRYAT